MLECLGKLGFTIPIYVSVYLRCRMTFRVWESPIFRDISRIRWQPRLGETLTTTVEGARPGFSVMRLRDVYRLSFLGPAINSPLRPYTSIPDSSTSDRFLWTPIAASLISASFSRLSRLSTSSPIASLSRVKFRCEM